MSIRLSKPEMCSDEAIEMGCTCYVPHARSTDIDPPEPRRDQWCPVHGRDADAERQRMLDRRTEQP